MIIDSEKPQRLLIIGAAGGLSQLVIRLILNKYPHWNVLGIDSRQEPTNSVQYDNFSFINMPYRRGNFENLFRNYQFDKVLHLGRITHISDEQDNVAKRLDLNVMGTNRILDLCQKKEISTVILLSTYHVYGAFADNPVFLTEDAPLRASIHYPELRDVVEMDQLCTSWMWRHQNSIRTVVLRPCNIIGSNIKNAMSRYLTSNLILRPIDYNPHFQFIHEFDMAQSILYALENTPTGVYNIAPDDYISLREAIEVMQPQSVHFPMVLARGLNALIKKIGLQGIPPYLIDYLTYSCLIDNSNFKKHLPENFFRFQVKQTLKLLRL